MKQQCEYEVRQLVLNICEKIVQAFFVGYILINFLRKLSQKILKIFLQKILTTKCVFIKVHKIDLILKKNFDYKNYAMLYLILYFYLTIY